VPVIRGGWFLNGDFGWFLSRCFQIMLKQFMVTRLLIKLVVNLVKDSTEKKKSGLIPEIFVMPLDKQLASAIGLNARTRLKNGSK